MFWPVMFEAAGNVGPERAFKNNADIIFGNLYLWGTRQHTQQAQQTASPEDSRAQTTAA